jgi:hypothetical protein
LTEELRNAFRLIADLIPSKDAGTARSGAIVTLSALVGAIELSRAVSDEALSREILKSAGELLKKQVQRTSRQEAKAQDLLRQNDEQRDQRCVFKTALTLAFDHCGVNAAMNKRQSQRGELLSDVGKKELRHVRNR